MGTRQPCLPFGRGLAQRTKVAGLGLALVLVASLAQAGPVENRDAALRGADRLLDVQFSSGALPWIIGQTGEFQNVQGVTAIALLDAFTLSLDVSYLGDEMARTGATGNVAWLTDYFNADPANRFSSGSFFFLAKYALFTGDADALQMANDGLDRSIDFYGDVTAMAEFIVEARKNQGHTLLGIWDVALSVRGAQDIGRTDEADAMAAVLLDQVENQTIVDPYDMAANWYEIGLSGLLFGLAESDLAAHLGVIQEAAERLKATQCPDGSFPTTFGGTVFCGGAQSTAYPVIGLTYALDLVPEAQAGCDYLEATQGANGGWDEGGTEFAENNAEAVSALVACVLPLHNGATAYGNSLAPGI